MAETLEKPSVTDARDGRGLQPLPAASAPDLRILQANERTLLAWIRTGLAVMAFGFVVARIGIWLRAEQGLAPSGSRAGWIGSAFVVLGTAGNALATVRYLRTRKAILQGREVVPGNATVLSLAFGLVVLGGILVAYLLTL